LYEAGFSGFGLHDSLVEDGYECRVIPPNRVTEEKCNRKKNDRTDCRRLAKICEEGDHAECDIPDVERREDRQVSRTYGQVSKDIGRIKNRIRRQLEWNGLDKHFPSGRWGEDEYRTLEARVKDLGVGDSLLYSFTIHLRLLREQQAARRDLLKRLSVLAKKDRYARTVVVFRSAPGIGSLTAIRLALEWGDVKARFKRKEQFCSYLGFIPSDYSTGETDRKGHITKEGNRAVRAWLVECSWAAIRKDPVLLEKFNRVTRSTGSKKKAIVAVARKLALRLRALVIQDAVYQLGIVE
jgi:transposase